MMIMCSPTINTTISYIVELVSQMADGPTNKQTKEGRKNDNETTKERTNETYYQPLQ
jgi:hypothetical protein